MRWFEIEREALAQTLLELGPDRPTVCEGWQTRHLAAHLYLRQHRPDIALGATFGPLKERTERAIQRLGDEHAEPGSYARLVDALLTGSGRWNPMELGGDAANLSELVIHHEDARRGSGPVPPRALPPGMEVALRGRFAFMARLAYRKDRDGVVLRTPGGARLWQRKGPAPVVLTGRTVELLLHASGRARVADVEITGSSAARDRFLARHR